ncbi:uncharacterized protein ISCGN_022112 [Ixodes scapularis]
MGGTLGRRTGRLMAAVLYPARHCVWLNWPSRGSSRDFYEASLAIVSNRPESWTKPCKTSLLCPVLFGGSGLAIFPSRGSLSDPGRVRQRYACSFDVPSCLDFERKPPHTYSTGNALPAVNVALHRPAKAAASAWYHATASVAESTARTFRTVPLAHLGSP